MSCDDDTRRFYAELWPHRTAVLRVAQILTRSSDDAEDLAQEALTKAFRSIHTLAPGSNAKAWLMTVLRSVHIDRIRAQRAVAISLDDLNVDIADPREAVPEDPTAWGDPDRTLANFSDAEIIDALKKLPREICWALLLVDVQQMNDAEAAEVLGVPTGTIKSRLHRGRRMLREALLPLAKDRRIGSAR